MKVDLLQMSSLKDSIKQLLSNEWVLIGGSRKNINTLEHLVYPPNTKANKGFIVFVLPLLKFVYLGKKTQKLREVIPNPYWNDLIGFQLIDVGSNSHVGMKYALKQDLPDLDRLIQEFI